MLKQVFFQTARRWFCGVMAIIFSATNLPVHASDMMTLAQQPGTMVSFSDAYQPPMLAGVKVRMDDPFRFDFILDKGDLAKPGAAAVDNASEAMKAESEHLIKYFLAALTVPEDDLWVNLSPYEKDRIIPDEFGLTEMGRDLLAQDYLLKQITASAIYPQEDLGREFWKKVYARAYEVYGSADIPVDTFNKVWIVPERAVVYEKRGGLKNDSAVAYVVEARLKVMLESDYVASAQGVRAQSSSAETGAAQGQELAKDVLREVVLPALEREVNEGKNFAPLRQIYHSLILADWYKKKVKDSLLSSVYIDQKKVVGVNVDDPEISRKIWAEYVETFKKGAFNMIREERDEMSGEMIPRKYFSGGCSLKLTDQAMTVTGAGDLPPNDPGRFAIISSGIRAAEVRGEAKLDRPGDNMSFHVSTLKTFLDGIDALGLIKDPPDPGNKDLFKKYFKGLKVVNLGPETKAYSFGRMNDPESFKTYSLVHAFRDRGIDAVAVSPRTGDPAADRVFDGVNFVEGLDRKMPFADSSKDVVLSISLYDPAYYEWIMGNGPLEYWAAAHEIRRVLKDGGRLIIHSMVRNPRLLEALAAEGFQVTKVVFARQLVNDTGMYICVNNKSSMPNSRPNFRQPDLFSDAAMAGEFRAKILKKQDELIKYAAALKADLPQVFSGIPWESAALVPWQEIIREPVPEDPGQPADEEDMLFGSSANRWHYWSNQIDVRRLFLGFLADALKSGREITREKAERYLKQAHHQLIFGAGDDSTYLPPTMLAMNLDRDVKMLHDVADTLHLTSEGIDAYASSMNVVLQSLRNGSRDVEALLPDLFRLHKIFITPGGDWSREGFAFSFGNNSLSMNQVNAILRLLGREGISHDGVDLVLLRNWQDETVAYDHFVKLMRSSKEALPEVVEGVPDSAQKGGIDLTRRGEVKTSGDAGMIRFDINPKDLEQLRDAPGFSPVIFSIQPVDDLLQFLGATAQDPAILAG